MANNDNQNIRFIYLRSTKEKISCTEQQFQDFYRMAGTTHKKEQYHHRCKCRSSFSGPAMATAQTANTISVMERFRSMHQTRRQQPP